MVYLYANDPDAQYTYIEAAKQKGYSVLLMDGQLDTPLVGMLERKLEKSTFTRVDGDVIDRLIQKEETKRDLLEAERGDKLSSIFNSQMPRTDKTDFHVQQAFNLALPAAVGENNVKLASVQGVREGAPIVIGRGADAQVVNVVKVGSAGGTQLVSAAGKTLVVASAQGFTTGQEVLVGGEKATVAEVIVPRGWWMPRAQQENKLVLTAPLRKAHKGGEAVSGTGVTLSEPLKAAWPAGAPAATGQPTPGAANQY